VYELSMSHDVNGITLARVGKTSRVEQRSLKRANALQSTIVGIKNFLPAFTRKLISAFIVAAVERKSTRIAENVMFFEGATDQIRRRIEATAVFPQADFVSKVTALRKLLNADAERRREISATLRESNNLSKVASCFLKLAGNLDALASALHSLEFVASGREHEAAQQRVAFQNLRTLIKSGDHSDIDPELFDLAQQAISASDSRDLSLDSMWSARMTQGPLH
jgi:hypothetical protein